MSHCFYPKETEFRHPYGFQRCLARLKDDYNKHGSIIVAFDFDNTIFDYHNTGGDFSEVIGLLKECSELGFTMILFSSNEEPEKLDWMVGYCNHFGIAVNFINKSPVMKTTKPYYNILLDDRAGLKESYTELKAFVEYIKESKDEK